MSNFIRILLTHKRMLLLLFSALALIAPLMAQESEITVTELQFELTEEKTSEKALRRWVRVTEGSTFSSEEELEIRVKRDVQELTNLRVFLSVDAEILPDTSGSATDRKVVFTIVDGNTFIPIPLPLYDSNTGGLQLLYVQIWDNMFGSLTNWFSLATLTLRRNDSGKIETGPWLFAPQVSNIKTGNLVFGVKFEQERVESQTYNGLSLTSDYRYDRSALFLNTEFRFGERRYLYYTIEPGAEFRYGYTDYLGTGDFSEKTFSTQLSQSFYYDSVNFFYNSRKGFKAGVSNTTGVYIQDEKWNPTTNFTGELAAYFAFGETGRFSYYTRLSGLHVFGDTYEKLGEPLRGIPDATMDGTTAVYLNQTVGASVWRWKGVWDLQIHPFFDMGFSLGGSTPFRGWQDVRKSAGADILLFIEKVPNLAFRFSWGVDLDSSVPWGDDNKTEFIVRYAYSY